MNASPFTLICSSFLLLAGIASAQTDVPLLIGAGHFYEENGDPIAEFIVPRSGSPYGGGFGGSYLVTPWEVRNPEGQALFVAFCAEQFVPTKFEPLPEGGADRVANYTYTAYSDAEVQELYDRYYAIAMSDPQQAAAFQLVLWQFLDGETVASYQSPTNIINFATTMLNTINDPLAAPVAPQYQLGRWENAQYQDVIQATAIPEPGSMASLGGCVIWILGAFRRRR